MNKRPATLHDVSAAAKVSTFTASRALSGADGVSAKTRDRVREVAASLGYVPNQHARNLKGASSNVVAMLTANIANQYYAALASSIEAVVEGAGYDCMIMDTMLAGEYSQSREDRFVASLQAQRVAAAVVTYNLRDANMTTLSEWGLPIVFVDCPVPQGLTGYSSVSSDSFQGSLEVGQHLASHGYQRWAFVGHTETWSTRRPRQEGYTAAANAAGAHVDVIEGRNSSATARTAVTQYLLQTPRSAWPQAVYASNTVLLRGTMEALRALGVQVPTDIAVVAFDDFDWAELLDPPITVADQDIAAIGAAAGAFVLRELRHGRQEAGEELVLRPTLRIRGSCGCHSVSGGMAR